MAKAKEVVEEDQGTEKELVQQTSLSAPSRVGTIAFENSPEWYFLQKNQQCRVEVSQDVDTVASRYKVLLSSPLEEYSSEFVSAYQVHDISGTSDANIYAIVFNNSYPIRVKAINHIINARIDGFCNAIAANVVTLSTDGSRAFVAIMEKPEGVTLYDYISRHGALSEDFITRKVVPVVAQVIQRLESNGIVHGRINAENIYIDVTNQMSIMVGECVSGIVGFSQDITYEMVDRAEALPAAKGAGDSRVDYYALGVFVAILLQGKNPLAGLSRKKVVDLKYYKTTYATVTTDLKISPHMLDLLRGTISELKNEIWSSEKILEWSKGRRFNLLPLASRVESTRPLVFAGKEYLNKKILAHDMFLKWDEAKVFIQEESLRKWIERSIQDTKMADKIRNMSSSVKGSGRDDYDRHDEMLTQIIILLDPDGPIRMKGFAVNLDGIGAMVAYAFAKSDKTMLRNLAHILILNLYTAWATAKNRVLNDHMQETIFDLKYASEFIKQAGSGFGMERCLYALNKAIACQSTKIQDLCIFDLRELLDILSQINYMEEPIIDVHTASFIAHSIEMSSKIKIKSLSRFPDMERNLYIQNLALISLAQQESGIKKLVPLCKKVVEDLKHITAMFHSNPLREELEDKMQKEVKKGVIGGVLKLLTTSNYIAKDRVGYKKAIKHYQYLSRQIIILKNKRALTSIGYHYGLKLSVILSFLTASLVFLVLILKVPF